ncbi:MAG: hypothetical protein JW881_00230 [Spirochaetales bacterium]|nr:hypothetical protein [Spirochaetales bacterium]
MAMRSYRHHAYHVINMRLDLAASSIASCLQRRGYTALPVPAAKSVDDERMCASLPHKLSARFAGFGWIGKSCFLVTPDHGPRVRWATVLTGAPLAPSGKPVRDRCRDCTA